MVQKLVLIIVIACACGALAEAQESTDLLGKWRFELEEADDPRCGARKTLGEMHVSKKITARAYRGTTTVQSVTDRCGKVSESASGFTLRVRDDRISIEYDEESWTSDSLVLEGDRLNGYDSAGTPMEFVKQAVTVSERTPEELAALDEFLESLAPDLSRELRAEFGQKMLQNLVRTGLSRDESIQVATQTVDRMTDCILDMARNQILERDIPIDDVVQGRNRTVLLQPENVDFREIECIYEAAQNAGVVIR